MSIIHTLIAVGVYIKFTYYFIKSYCCSMALLESSVHLQGRDPNTRNAGIPDPENAPRLVSVSDNQQNAHTKEFSQSGDAEA
ncbi:hypothetical protein AVEN_231907-1 [Araneus ventricosus]|uniref:Uncharacterized protein n=1 Tax=Araneus ventricosus TaxID=182803 RepID=A0A4Y2S5C1_ARAVE|nr:hypothetical protein AVEN_22299-1 [Araneus ventricosus]GBN82545.1 hypothetical protein AVEN_231907-1 [Araneus ventricosus]